MQSHRVDAVFTGTWSDWESTSQLYYQGSAQYKSCEASGTATATFTPNLPQTGDYEVYGWWYASSNRATNVPYTINHSAGADTVLVNQQQGGGWIYLGTYTFNAGAGGSVVVSDNADAGKYVMPDAVKFKLVETKQNVELSDNANGYVIADAILFEPAD